MNYHGFAVPVKGFLIDEVLPASAAAKDFDARRNVYPQSVQYALQNLLDSHDTDRLASMIVNAGKRPTSSRIALISTMACRRATCPRTTSASPRMTSAAFNALWRCCR